MNYRLVSKYIGYFSFTIGLVMIPSALWAVYFSEWDALRAFLLSMAMAGVLGGALTIMGRRAPDQLWQREALTLVSLSWFVAAFLGGFPFLFAGVLGPVDAFFESMSGFTTTGSTVIKDIEATPRSILFWRSMMQWLGGVGIVVLFIAVLPYLGAGGKQLFRSESSGPSPHGLTPRIKDTASILYKIYGGFTIAMTIALMAFGMSFFDALCHTMSALSTGGFSPKQASIGAYDQIGIEITIMIGMAVGGTSFALFFVMLRKDWLAPLRDTEWKVYMLVAAIAFALIAINLSAGEHQLQANGAAETYTVKHSLRSAAFQTMSIYTGTGFVTEDFDRWPSFSRVLLFMLMFTGGCAGSTTGGMKIVRLVILAKIAYWRVENTFRPKTVRAIRISNQVIDDDTRRSIHSFFVIYISWFVFGSLVMAGLGLPFESALCSVAATLNNIGPGLGLVGATQNYSDIPAVGKLFLSLCMVLGRLELFSVCVLFVPAFWKHS